MHLRLSTLAFLCAGLTAQSGDNSEGPFVALPAAMSVDSATVLPFSNSAAILFNHGTLTSAPPSLWTPKPGYPTLPDFGALPFMALVGLDVDALSIGMDKVDATSTGVMAAFGVGGFVYSVTRSTVGLPNSLIANEVAEPGGAAGDIFSYMLPGSFGPTSFNDRPMRSQDASEIAVYAGGAPGNVDAHDLLLGLFFHDSPHMSAFVPGIPNISVYFSVSTASVPAIPALWWNGGPASGATILRTTWNQATASWSRPQPAYQPVDFGLQPQEDIDALALDLSRNYALFSTTQLGAPVVRNPLLFVNLSTPGAHHVYRRADGTPASTRLGLAGNGVDDIDSLSAIEPVATNPLPINHLVGTMFPRLLSGLPNRLSNTVTLRLNAAGTNEEAVSRMIGSVVPGPVGSGFAAVTLALGSAAGPYFTMGTNFRPDISSPFFAFEGHPEEYVITIPRTPSFFGAQIYFTWGAFDIGANAFDLTPPVGITL